MHTAGVVSDGGQTLIDYIIYHSTTGEIRQSGRSASLEGLEQALPEHCLLLEGFARGDATHVVNRRPVVRERPRSYIEDRQAAYPATGEQLDAIAELAAALRAQGIALPAKTLAWLDDVQAVKANNPKAAL